MQKLAAMIQSLVQYVKSLFRVGISTELIKAPCDGQSKQPVDLDAPCVSGMPGEILSPLPHVPQKKLKRPKYYAPNAKLTYKDAEMIREAVGLNILAVKEAAHQYRVSLNTISKLLAYKTYKADLPRSLPPRFRVCTACKALIPDRVNGVRIPPVIWKDTHLCGPECEITFRMIKTTRI